MKVTCIWALLACAIAGVVEADEVPLWRVEANLGVPRSWAFLPPNMKELPGYSQYGLPPIGFLGSIDTSGPRYAYYVEPQIVPTITVSRRIGRRWRLGAELGLTSRGPKMAIADDMSGFPDEDGIILRAATEPEMGHSGGLLVSFAPVLRERFELCMDVVASIGSQFASSAEASPGYAGDPYPEDGFRVYSSEVSVATVFFPQSLVGIRTGIATTLYRVESVPWHVFSDLKPFVGHYVVAEAGIILNL